MRRMLRESASPARTRTRSVGPIRAMVVVLALVATMATAWFAVEESAAAAPSGGAFNPGEIISDAQFYDSRSMSEADIQNFLRNTRCIPRDGVPCLADYRQSTQSRGDAGSNHCGAYAGAADEPASRIIAKVAQACGISPKVLLVLMQKEQSLITNPSGWGYQQATGANCPDTPQGCDPAYSGFFIQVYSAAWQFRQYAKYPANRNYRIGNSYVQWNPNAGCGGSVVNIRNQATANLYIYTPYQPNAAALANMYGTGDGCSSYGNRNFWRTYWDWFGSPTDSSPIGAVENMQPIPGGIGIWGWAVDIDTSVPVIMHVYVDGAFATGVGASTPRADIGQRFGLGDNHGFSISVPAGPGSHRVCVYALNVGSGQNTEVGCGTVSVRSGNPVGQIENAQPQPGGIGVWGHAIDPDTPDSIWVHAYLDGAFAGGYYANAARADLGSRYPGYGNNHAFGFSVPASAGAHRLCLYAINVGNGTTNTEIGCSTVIAGGNPVGSGVSATAGLGGMTITGWAVDPDTQGPIWTHVYIDGRFAGGVFANRARNDLGIYQAYGPDHGYEATYPTGVGWHEACVYAMNVGTGNANTLLGCTSVEVGGSPVGQVENGQPGFGSIGVWGWTYDLDTADPIGVHIYMDGRFVWGGGANTPRSDVNAIPQPYGDNHGFAANFAASPGTHEVCAFALNVGRGDNTRIGCFTTTVAGDPVGQVENVQTVNGGLGVWGFAVDPNTSGPIDVHMYLDGQFAGAATANQSRSDIGGRFPGYGDSHAFSGWIAATPGAHQLCVYAINQPSGNNPAIGCLNVTRQ